MNTPGTPQDPTGPTAPITGTVPQAEPIQAEPDSRPDVNTDLEPDIQPDPKPVPKAKHLWLKRILLSLGSFVFLWLLLELAAFLLTPNQYPWHLRDGIYCNSLPLVTGHSQFGFPPSMGAGLLPAHKRPGEFRILVFGESSIEGIPLDHYASPPTMLHDQLKAAFPDRDFTVVNMGKTGSIATNVFYYLLVSRSFEPDAIIFYFGANDASSLGGEQCWAGEHPKTHAVWRSLVRNSPMLRSLRIYLPQILWSGQSGTSGGQQGCSVDPFVFWTRELVRLALESAPLVFVTSPVTSALKSVEQDGRTLAEALQDPLYSSLLRCKLDPTCDLPALFKKQVVLPSLFALLIGMQDNHYAEWVTTSVFRAETWEESAAELGATYIDFYKSLRSISPGEIIGLRNDQFADEIHLTLQGYMYLARHWTEALRPHLTGETSRTPEFPQPHEVAQYGAAIRVWGYSPLLNYVRRGWLLTCIDGFQALSTLQGHGVRRDLALMVIGWTRAQVGLDPQLPPDLAPLLPLFDPTAVPQDQMNDDLPLRQRLTKEAP